MIKVKRTIHLSDTNKSSFKPGAKYTTYGYTIKDLAILYELSEGYIRNLISKGIIDPFDLKSIINYYND